MTSLTDERANPATMTREQLEAEVTTLRKRLDALTPAIHLLECGVGVVLDVAYGPRRPDDDIPELGPAIA